MCRIVFNGFFVTVTLLLVLLHTAHGLIPLVCSEPANFNQQRCCPEPFPGAGPCGSHLSTPRGNCVWVATESNTSDVRRNWPHYFNQICKCNAQFGNFDCGECEYGRRGEDCSEKYTKKRRFINNLSPDELQEYVDTLYAAKQHPSRYASISRETTPGTVPPMHTNVTVYNLFVWIHYYVSKETYVDDYAHGGPAFLTWHRMVLLWIEREIEWMLGGGKTFSIPYWDWSTSEHRTFPFSTNVLGLHDKDGYLTGNFGDWDVICTDVMSNVSVICNPALQVEKLTRCNDNVACSANYSKWPNRIDIYKALKISVYDQPPYNEKTMASGSFRNYLEGFNVSNEQCVFDDAHSVCNDSEDSTTLRMTLHNQVHNMLLGVLSIVSVAANDPIFVNHHSMVDYLLEMWIRRYHGDYQPPPGSSKAHKGHNYYDSLVPFLPLYTSSYFLQESTQFGYTYDQLEGLEFENGEHLENQNGDQTLPLSSWQLFPIEFSPHSHSILYSNYRQKYYYCIPVD